MKSNLKPHPIQLYRDSVLVKQQQTLNELDLQYDAYVKRIRNQQKEIKKQMKLLFYREITGIDSDIANFNININNNNHTIGTHNKSIKMDIYAISNNINNRKHHTNNNRNIPILGADNAQNKNKNTTTPSSNTKHNKNPCYPSSKNNLMHSENAQNNTFNINQINSINKPFCNGIIPPLPSLPPLPPLPPISTLNSIKSLPSIPSQFLTQSTNGHNAHHPQPHSTMNKIINLLLKSQQSQHLQTNSHNSPKNTTELDSILTLLAFNNMHQNMQSQTTMNMNMNTPPNPNGATANSNAANLNLSSLNKSISMTPITTPSTISINNPIGPHTQSNGNNSTNSSDNNTSVPPLIEVVNMENDNLITNAIKQELHQTEQYKLECDNMPIIMSHINIPPLPSINAMHTANSVDVNSIKEENPLKSELNKCKFQGDEQHILLEDIPLISRVMITEPSVLIHKTSDNRKWKCDFCRKWIEYCDDANVIIHLINHKQERKFKCLYCEKVFKRKSDVTRHSRTHTGEKPHKCSICGKGFGTKYCLKTHIRTHTGEMPYKCSFCGKCFRQNSHLTVHWRTHTGDKPYECKICQKRFSQHSTLAVHHRIHNGQKPFVCPCCNRQFTQRHSLQRHIKNVHKEYYLKHPEKINQIHNIHTVQKMKEKEIQNNKAREDKLLNQKM